MVFVILEKRINGRTFSGREPVRDRTGNVMTFPTYVAAAVEAAHLNAKGQNNPYVAGDSVCWPEETTEELVAFYNQSAE